MKFGPFNEQNFGGLFLRDALRIGYLPDDLRL